ncbi:MAG: T9SS type A sorting domain-containing protein, partial [Chitinophagaceae bacterium]
NNKNLSIERRPFIVNITDTIYLAFNNLIPNTNYILDFNAQGWDASMQAFLVDKLLITETPINLQLSAQDINITSTSATVTNRWMIVFRGTGSLPNNNLVLTAIKQDKKVEINWAIKNEIGVNSYELERSVDGISFKTIGQVNAKGGGDYNFTDVNLPNTTNLYYRLQIIDKNGSKTYSEIKTVVLNNTNQIGFSIYPNPNKGIINIIVEEANPKGTLMISDVFGKQLHQQNFKAKTVLVNKKLAAGTYFITINNQTQKIVVE